jgi:hypothetical protein
MENIRILKGCHNDDEESWKYVRHTDEAVV